MRSLCNAGVYGGSLDELTGFLFCLSRFVVVVVYDAGHDRFAVAA
jgi:hypothetical protein